MNENEWVPIANKDDWSQWARKHGGVWNSRLPKDVPLPFAVRVDPAAGSSSYGYIFDTDWQFIQGAEIHDLFCELFADEVDGG